MFWIVILIAGLVLSFVKLGMYSVWVTVLVGGLKVAAVAILCLVVLLVWKRILKK
jgi:hypothetical protein